MGILSRSLFVILLNSLLDNIYVSASFDEHQWSVHLSTFNIHTRVYFNNQESPNQPDSEKSSRKVVAINQFEIIKKNCVQGMET